MRKQWLSQLFGMPPRRAVRLKMPRSVRKTDLMTESELIRQEGRIGAEVFGPIPKGRQRTFFCLDENTWIWSEKWTDPSGRPREVVVEYKVQGERVLKTYNNLTSYLEGAELTNFRLAIGRYVDLVARDVYQAKASNG